MRYQQRLTLLCCLTALGATLALAADLPLMQVLDPGETPDDARLIQRRDTDTVYTMPHYATRAAWEEKAAQLRRRVLASSGLWPLPEKTPLNAKVFDKFEGDGFTVEKVHFEAWPGFLVTGNLWRPVGKTGKVPGVVSPHGHWENGRLEDSPRGSVPARGITLARMGMVAFTYDMVGYVDSRQVKNHRFVDKEAALWGIHPFALQLWSSIRAVDFLESLPDVDANRIGCTGASGGGTQTFALYTVDDRIKVAAPVNMISSTMQGGCVCENAPFIRLDNSNMEIGACMAPRPLLMVSATGDWTRETPRVEYPAIHSIYELYDATDRLETHQVTADHNYNQESREAMYRFFGKWLLGEDGWEAYTEPAYELPPTEALRVFPGDGVPEGYPAHDELIQRLIAMQRQRWDVLLATTGEAREELRNSLASVYQDVMGVEKPNVNDLVCERRDRIVLDSYTVEKWILGRRGVGDAVPAVLILPDGNTPLDAELLVHGDGKAALMDADSGGLGLKIIEGLKPGRAVLAIDLFLTGEYGDAKRKPGMFPETFVPTVAACRVQDVLTAKVFLDSRRDLSGRVYVTGLGYASLPVLFAAASDGTFASVRLDTKGFDPRQGAQWIEQFNAPSICALGGIRTADFLLGDTVRAVF